MWFMWFCFAAHQKKETRWETQQRWQFSEIRKKLHSIILSFSPIFFIDELGGVKIIGLATTAPRNTLDLIHFGASVK